MALKAIASGNGTVPARHAIQPTRLAAFRVDNTWHVSSYFIQLKRKQNISTFTNTGMET